MVRGKWKCTAAEKGLGPDQGTTFRFEPVCRENSDGTPEDVFFNKYTPSGQISMFVNNPAAEAQFQRGKFYYFDATPVPVLEETPAAAESPADVPVAVDSQADPTPPEVSST